MEGGKYSAWDAIGIIFAKIIVPLLMLLHIMKGEYTPAIFHLLLIMWSWDKLDHQKDK